MKGRFWVVVGVVAGIAIGVGRLAYFEGAAVSLCDTILRVVDTAGLTLIHDAAKYGAPRRVVLGLTAALAVVLPGVAALLLVVAARATMRLRRIIGLLIAALGIAAFFYLPGGTAVGVAALALLAAALVVAVTGPLVVAPLAALAALIATVFLPRLLLGKDRRLSVPIADLHQALFSTIGSPYWLRIAVVVLAAVPFGLACRLIVRGLFRG